MGNNPEGVTPNGDEHKSPGANESDQTIPKVRFDQVIEERNEQRDAREQSDRELQALRESQARLEGQLEASQQQSTKQQQPVEYSRPQLAAMVDNGQISQADMDVTLESQLRTKITSELEQSFDAKLNQVGMKNELDSQFTDYQGLVPGIMDPAHENRRKVQEEFTYLTNTLGMPANRETELAATRSVFGTVENLRRAKDSTANDRETHQETGGEGGGGSTFNGAAESNTSILKKLSAGKKQHYAKMIEAGRHKDWDEVAELERKYG